MKKRLLIPIFSACCAVTLGLGLAGCQEKKPEEEKPTPTEESIQVTDYMLDNERKFTGTLKNGKPEGEGALEWVLTNCFYTGNFENGLYSGEGKFEWKNDGNTFVGTFENNEPKEGKFTYANTMSYTGTFQNWQFDGRGVFDWNRYNPDGTLYDAGWLYEGEFKKGTIAGCTGKLTMKRSGNDAAVYWFEGEMSGFPAIKKDQQGRGFIRYPDKSTYEGEIYYTASGEWLRKGEGVMDFTDSSIKGSAAGGLHEDKLLYYRGQFDAGVTGWMYGDGVMYFCNPEDQTPTGYIKGSWRGMTRTGDWQGEWKDEYLLEAWRGAQEVEWKSEFTQKLKGFVSEIGDEDLTGKMLLIGASHFEFWSTCRQDMAPEYEVRNVAVGGSNIKFWDESFSELDVLKGCPEYVVYCEMGNSFGAGIASERFTEYIKSLADKVQKRFPQSKFIFVSGIVSVSRWSDKAKMQQTNAAIAAWAETQENVFYADVCQFLFDASATSGKYYDEKYGALRTDIWRSDNMHFNAKGYAMFTSALKESFATIDAVQAPEDGQ